MGNELSKLIEDEKNSKTLQLDQKRIMQLPREISAFSNLQRLSLENNLLRVLPDEFENLVSLKKLNLRSNLFKQFPEVLGKLPQLEVLDISRNQIKQLPSSLAGGLINLKVLSIAKNRISLLPRFIADMSNLKILKIYQNPLLFPPPEISDYQGSSMDSWLIRLKDYLATHEVNLLELETNGGSVERGAVSDDASGKEDWGLNDVKSPLLEQDQTFPESTSNSNNLSPAKLEHSRSRGGAYSMSSLSRVGNSSNHHRGASADSISSLDGGSGAINGGGGVSPNQSSSANNALEGDRVVELYFQKLNKQFQTTSLPRDPFLEVARTILHSSAVLYRCIRAFSATCTDLLISLQVKAVLQATNENILLLLRKLVFIDGKLVQNTRPDPILYYDLRNACRQALSCFKKLFSLLNEHLRSIAMGTDVRVVRNFWSTLHGAIFELRLASELLGPSVIEMSGELNEASVRRRDESQSAAALFVAPPPRPHSRNAVRKHMATGSADSSNVTRPRFQDPTTMSLAAAHQQHPESMFPRQRRGTDGPTMANITQRSNFDSLTRRQIPKWATTPPSSPAIFGLQRPSHRSNHSNSSVRSESGSSAVLTPGLPTSNPLSPESTKFVESSEKPLDATLIKNSERCCKAANRAVEILTAITERLTEEDSSPSNALGNEKKGTTSVLKTNIHRRSEGKIGDLKRSLKPVAEGTVRLEILLKEYTSASGCISTKKFISEISTFLKLLVKMITVAKTFSTSMPLGNPALAALQRLTAATKELGNVISAINEKT